VVHHSINFIFVHSIENLLVSLRCLFPLFALPKYPCIDYLLQGKSSDHWIVLSCSSGDQFYDSIRFLILALQILSHALHSLGHSCQTGTCCDCTMKLHLFLLAYHAHLLFFLLILFKFGRMRRTPSGIVAKQVPDAIVPFYCTCLFSHTMRIFWPFCFCC